MFKNSRCIVLRPPPAGAGHDHPTVLELTVYCIYKDRSRDNLMSKRIILGVTEPLNELFSRR